jgi:hypothetical protein
MLGTAIALLLVLPGVRADEGSPADRFQFRGRSPSLSETRIRPGADLLTIPAETEAQVLLLSGLHSDVSHVNDPIKAQLLQPVYVNGRLALPAGTLLDGRVTMVRAAGRLQRSAELAFRFERITLPDGQASPVLAVLKGFEQDAPFGAHLETEGTLKGGKFSWKKMAGGLAALGAASTAGLAFGGPATLAYILPGGGAGFLSYTYFWARGKDVHIPPETRLRIRLDHPLTVRVWW